MNTEHQHIFIIGGVSGIVAVILYVVAISLSLPPVPSQFEISVVFVIATGWPIISTVSSYALYRLIALERQGLANRLAFLLSLFGFATVTTMLSVQLAVQFGMHEYQQASNDISKIDWLFLLRVMRLIDMGFDVAWDLFMGWSMVMAAFPIYRHSRLGRVWAIPSFILGLLLVTLNTATFPWPPASKGLFDIGPAVGFYMLLLNGRVLNIGLRWHSEASSQKRSEPSER